MVQCRFNVIHYNDYDREAKATFGTSVSTNGELIVVGAHHQDGPGAVYVFTFDEESKSWVEDQKLVAHDREDRDRFGRPVSVSGDAIAIGAWGSDDLCPEDSECDSGAAYIFRHDGEQWVEEQKLLPSDGARGDGFGVRIFVDGDVAVVGAHLDDDRGVDSGSAYVFRFNGSEWEEEAKLTASAGAEGDSFGVSVCLSDGVALIVGRSGKAYVFEHDGADWIESAKLVASDGGNLTYKGFIDGDLVVVRSSDEAVYVFEKPADGWKDMTETAKLTASDAGVGDSFGESLGRTLGPDEVVAINDAGAIAYFSGRRTLDLVGLTTPHFAGLWPQGSGALWEKLETLPPGDRPDWFCFFPNWFEFDALGILRRKGSVRLFQPSIVDAEKVLALADWSLAGSGDRPRLGGPGARIVDRLDVADIASEQAHDFRWSNAEHGGDAGTFVRRASFAGTPGDEAIDGGRTVFGAVEFTVARDPASPAAVVVRCPTGVRQRVHASVDGGEEREVEIYSPGAGGFHEQAVAQLAPGAGTARIRLRLTEEAAGSAPMILTHVFVLSGAGE